MTGEPLGAFRQQLAAAQAEVSPEQVALIDGALRKVDHCDPAAVAAGEHLLVDAAASSARRSSRWSRRGWWTRSILTGSSPRIAGAPGARFFFHLKHRGDGSWAGDSRLTPELGQKLHALLGPLSAPQTTRYATGEGDDATRQVEADLRTHGQRRHDALEAMVDRLLRGGDLPESGGIPTTLLIVMSYADYLAGQGVAHYADGSPLSVPNALRLADQADLAWCVKDAKGAVLDLFGPGGLPVSCPDARADRPRRGLQLPRLRHRAAVVRAPSHPAVAGRRRYESGQLDPALPLSPPPLRAGLADLPTQRGRSARLDPTEVDRPTTTADPEPTHHRQNWNPQDPLDLS